jgi:hypothetical protein
MCGLELYTSSSLGDGDKEEQRINDFGDRERIKRTMTCCLFFFKKKKKKELLDYMGKKELFHAGLFNQRR